MTRPSWILYKFLGTKIYILYDNFRCPVIELIVILAIMYVLLVYGNGMSSFVLPTCIFTQLKVVLQQRIILCNQSSCQIFLSLDVHVMRFQYSIGYLLIVIASCSHQCLSVILSSGIFYFDWPISDSPCAFVIMKYI